MNIGIYPLQTFQSIRLSVVVSFLLFVALSIGCSERYLSGPVYGHYCSDQLLQTVPEASYQGCVGRCIRSPACQAASYNFSSRQKGGRCHARALWQDQTSPVSY